MRAPEKSFTSEGMSDLGTSETGSRAADRIVRVLQTQIQSGLLANATPLPPERHLMEAFNASRTVVREAIYILSGRGLVSCRPRRRPIVQKPGYESVLNASRDAVFHLLNDVDGVRNLFKARAFVERGLVRDAALNAQPEQIALLEKLLTKNEALVEDSPAFYASDIAFHAALFEISDNPVFPAIHNGFVAWLTPNWERMPLDVARNATNAKAHRRIFEAIRERDPDRAETALTEHLDAAWSQVRATFDGLDD